MLERMGAIRLSAHLKSVSPSRNIPLIECDELAFSMRTATFAPAANILEGKAIGVTWKCSRTFAGNKIHTEDMEQALIVIRNKPP